jgi:hypothetical protein
MIARGFKPVAWVAAIGTAALGCYMLSLQVAAERAELAGLERKIISTEQSIRSLQTELGTRARMVQLQQWNDEILALAPPAAGQFLESQMVLARFSVNVPPVLENPAEVRMASAEVPAPVPAPAVATPRPRAAAPVVAAAQPAVRRASLDTTTTPAPQTKATAPRARASASAERTATQPARVRTAVAQPAARPLVGQTQPARSRTLAATTQTQPRVQRISTASAEPTRRPAATRTAPRRGLLDERTQRELSAASRSERRGGTRD